MGRPYVDIDLDRVEKLAMVGCSADEIAAELNIGERTLWRRCGTVLRSGAKKSHVRIRSALFKRAVSGSDPVLIFLAKAVLGMREPREDAVTVNVSQTAITLTPQQLKANLTELRQAVREEAKRFVLN